MKEKEVWFASFVEVFISLPKFVEFHPAVMWPKDINVYSTPRRAQFFTYFRHDKKEKGIVTLIYFQACVYFYHSWYIGKILSFHPYCYGSFY